MYGLVNKAVQDFIETEYGAEAWLRIRKLAQVECEEFICMSAYDDKVTYDLVQAAETVVEVSPPDFLEAFGVHWTTYSAGHGYGQILDSTGCSFVDFLRSLNALHRRVALSLQDLRPPSFECCDVTDSTLRLHYRSERSGLTSFVVGLIRGVGQMFGLEVRVRVEARRGDVSDHDVFFVEYSRATRAATDDAPC